MKRTPRRLATPHSVLLLAALLIPLHPGAPLASGAAARPATAAAFAARAGVDPGMDDVRERLRDAGQSDAEIDALLMRVSRAARPSPTPAAPAAATPAASATPVRVDSVAPRRANAAPNAREPFGFEIFRWSPTTFEPLSYGPVDPDYPLGPGDELALTLWGDSQLSIGLALDREGFVALPDVGQVNLQGLTLEEARARLRTALARVYSGLRPSGQRSTTFLSVSIGRLRTIQVFLLGQVERPGSYTLSSVSRVLNALYAGGGPSRDGSLRDVRILRGGQVTSHVDLYEVILGGDPGRVARLQNGDVVFVPPAERRVTVFGPVRRPGIFELRSGEQLRALLALAGGASPEAELTRAQVDRIVPPAWRDSLPGQGRVAIDVPLGRVLADSNLDVPMSDGDSLTVFALPERRANFVRVDGRGIARPGRYEYRPGMRVSDLITAAGGVTTDAYLGHALVTRTLPDSSRVALRFAPERALLRAEADDLPLRPLDDLSIRSLWDLKERQTVSVHGHVRSPGTFELLEGMTLADALVKAGGLTDDADAQRAEVARVAGSGIAANVSALAETLEVPLQRDLAAAREAQAMRLQPHDAVFVRRDPSYAEPQFVTISGEARFPGAYALMRRDERVSDLVRRAGGLTDYAYARGAAFTRQGHQALAVDLPQALRRSRAASNLVLQPGDALHVPRFTPTVTVEGAVYSPVTALYQEGEGVRFYVTQANGFRPDADRHNVVLISPNGRVRRHGDPEPGSRVVVPTRPQEESRDHLKDFATLMSVIASMATTIVLVQQTSR